MSNNKIFKKNLSITHNTNHHNLKNIKIFGFWIYLMSDCLIFATLCSVYILLKNNISNGPTIDNIYKLPYIFIETILLLCSSITYSIALKYIFPITIKNKNKKKINIWLVLTAILGFNFVYMETQEFYDLIIQGYGPNKSAFLSSFFTLLGTHNLHMISGIIWIIIMITQIHYYGLTTNNQIRLQCLGLFWHFLDIIWLIIITIVYLLK
ncbi:MAG: cytochrome bo3 ubiquinol oxidase subunit 3 [Candidatus Westeberhardia cardiocondylae]|nr:cytochrome bo3 ubiquinol oxidase subunit 3 [Candidatus Westeberhardia cardiocondylae]